MNNCPHHHANPPEGTQVYCVRCQQEELERLREEREKTWTLSIERLTGELCAVIREPGKMDTAVAITEKQLPWFNALRELLHKES